jgi:5'-nucleotidase (lipoprotein e(P4) family)
LIINSYLKLFSFYLCNFVAEIHEKMKNILFIGIFALIISCQNKPNTQIEKDGQLNNDILLTATAWYQMSAEMDACYYQAFFFAEKILKENLQNTESHKPAAIVLDIDETILDNSPFQAKMIETGKPFSRELWKSWTDLGSAEALPGAIEFLNTVQSLGVEIYYISNRQTDELESTIQNMTNLGFPELERSHFLFKEKTSNKDARRAIVNKDYDVLLFIGDNLNDFSNFLGDRKENYGKTLLANNKDFIGQRFIILPNPMYGSWEDVLKNNSETESQQEYINFLKKSLVSF